MNITIVNAIAGICFALLTIEFVYVLYKLAFSNRKRRLAFLKNFKVGRCAVVYVIAIPLYLVGHIYGGTTFLDGFFTAIHQSVNLVVLKYSTDTVALLMGDSAFYAATMYYCFILVAFNAILFISSLAGQRIWRTLNASYVRRCNKDKLFIFGWCEQSEQLYKSDTSRAKLIIDELTAEEKQDLYVKKIGYVPRKANNFVSVIFSDVVKRSNRYVIVINESTQEQNIAICDAFVHEIRKYAEGGDENLEQDIFDRLQIYVFGNPQYEAIYTDLQKRACGCLRYVNKYQRTAIDFVKRYPFALFMDEKQLDYSTSLVNEGVDINALMIGFGKANRQIFLTSVANNQFMQPGEDGPVIKQVNYYIFDKENAENNKNLNHSYYRFKTETAGEDKDKYLPLPEMPANEVYRKLDVNDNTFYAQIRSVLESNKKGVNFAVIAFGSDLDNIDLAYKLKEKRSEWNIDNFILFVKVRRAHDEISLFNGKDCFEIGNEEGCVYDINALTNGWLYSMARSRDELYSLEYDYTSGTVDKNEIKTAEYVEKCRKACYKNWYVKRSQLERDSSIYCCLSLRSKLNLIGLDCVRKDAEGQALSNKEYLDIYSKGFPLVPRKDKAELQGKPIIAYDLNFPPSLRTNLAINEHQRWNAYMISKGLVPATIDEILNEKDERGKFTKGKNYALRRHGNITTMQGLVQFRKLIAEKFGKSEEDCDVIKYDYQLMDDAWWLLDKNGYKIVKKEKID